MMLHEQGYACIIDPEDGTKECSTITCCHCNKIVHVPPKKVHERTDFCRSCMKMICLDCAGKGCTPFLKKIERWEARHRARQSY